MTPFETAIAIVLQHEGGYVANPHDKGGSTNFGITQRTLNQYRNDTANVGFPATVDHLTREQAGIIYLGRYWFPLQLERVAVLAGAPLAAVLMDQAVLNGPNSVASRLQTVLGLSPDGTMGPLTFAALAAQEPKALAFRFLRASHRHYLAIVKANPDQLVFLSGWTDRLFSLMDYFFFGSSA